uniref:Uncharacterized protein n=1 Tax=Megaselia scalaris TaxID=36166 RepID=T1GUL0_MEGSC
MDREARKFIWKLDGERLAELCRELDLDIDDSAPTAMKLKIGEMASNATLEQFEILKRWSEKEKENKDKLNIHKWVYGMSRKECSQLLRQVQIPVEGAEFEQKNALIKFFNSSTGVVREGFVEMAEDFLVNQNVLPSSTRNNHKSEHSYDSNQSRRSRTLRHQGRNESFNPHPHGHDSVQEKHSHKEGRGFQKKCKRPDKRMSCEESSNSESSETAETESHYRPERESIVTRRWSTAQLMDTVRKWNIYFSYTEKPQDAITFLDRVKERAECYKISKDRLPKAMPEFLRGQALEWYRNNNEEWRTWGSFTESFTSFFVPPKMKLQFQDDVTAYLQKQDQKEPPTLEWCQLCRRRVPSAENCGCKQTGTSQSRKDQSIASASNVNEIQSDTRPHAVVELEGRRFIALLDTGSTASYINGDVGTFLKECGVLKGSMSSNIRLADGSVKLLSDFFELDITLFGNRMRHKFTIMPTLSESILVGDDLLKKNNVHLRDDFGNIVGTEIDKQVVMEIMNEDIQESSPICAMENISNRNQNVSNKKGKLNVVPDTLSRDAIDENEVFSELCNFVEEDLEDCAWIKNKKKAIQTHPEKHSEYMIENGRLFRNMGCGLTNMAKASVMQAKYYNLRRRDWRPEVGELVYKRNFPQSNAQNAYAAKLAPVFSGPFRVLNYISPTIVELKSLDINDKRIRKIHLKDIKRIDQR